MSLSPKRAFYTIIAVSSLFWLGGGYSLFGFISPLPPFSIKEEKALEHMKTGLLHLHSARYNAARESFHRALSVSPDFHLARRFLGDSLFLGGDWEAALENWNTLLQVGYESHILGSKVEAIRHFMVKPPAVDEEFSLYNSYYGKANRGYRFEGPSDLWLDEDNNLWILAYTSRNLVVMGPNGQGRENIRGGDERFEGPVAMAPCGDFIFIADYNADYIHKINRMNDDFDGFGETGSGPGQFHGPAGITCQNSQLLVSDSGNRRLQRFDLEGRFLSEIKSGPEGRLLFEQPLGVSADEQSLFVADGRAGVVHELDAYGSWVRTVGAAHLKAPRGIRMLKDELFISDEQQGLFIFNRAMNSWKQRTVVRRDDEKVRRFHRLFNSWVDKNGSLYTADFKSNQVDVFLPGSMRTTNLDLTIERVITDSFPDMAVIVSVRNRNGNFIRGLSALNFHMAENDVRVAPLRTDYLKQFEDHMQVIVAVEESPVMKKYQQGFRYVLQHLLGPLKVTDRLAHLSIGEQILFREDYTNSRLKLLNSLEKLQFPAEDSRPFVQIGKGLYTGIDSLVRRKGPRAVLLLLSGEPHEGAFNQYGLQKIINFSRTSHVPLFVLSFANRDRVNPDYLDSLEQLTSSTGGRMYFAYHSSELTALYDHISMSGEKRYLLNYESRLGTELSGHYVDLSLKVSYQGMQGLWNSGYYFTGD